MTRYLLAYGATLVTFLALDAVYLSTVGMRMFKATLGDVIAPSVNVPAAVLFYLIFPIGLVIFAVEPALSTGRWTTAAVYGLLLGFFAYATYDLTNLATIRNWSATISLVDCAWGTVASGAAATVAYFVTRAATSS